MDVAFLGSVSEMHSFEDVVTRASNWQEFRFLQEMDLSEAGGHVIYGERGAYADNICLIIPYRGTGLVITDRKDPEIVWYQSTDDRPVLFIEKGEGMNSPSLIRAVRDGSDDFLLTGFDAVSGELRTEQHMAVHDVTPYIVTGEAIPVYGQVCFDSLQRIPEAAGKLAEGWEVMVMADALIHDENHVIYVLRPKTGDDIYFAVHWDTETHDAKALRSADGMVWDPVEIPARD